MGFFITIAGNYGFISNSKNTLFFHGKGDQEYYLR
jgi:hypothetical protein